MNEQRLLELLCELEWSGPDHGDVGTCPICQRPQTLRHNEPCDMATAIFFVQARCSKQAAWNLIAEDFGPGHVIALPTEPRVWGAWNRKSWMMRHNGDIITDNRKGVILAQINAWGDKDIQAREIGPDGLPVPTD